MACLFRLRILVTGPKAQSKKGYAMTNKSPTSANTFLFNIEKIKTLVQLREAFKHNRREIQKELGATSHIDSQKIENNFSLVKVESTADLMHQVKGVINTYQINTGRTIRKNAVIALEVLFSLPAAATGINIRDYFNDCLLWSEAQLSPAKVLTADVHLDEATPHMHVLLLCVTPTHLVASNVKGNHSKFMARKDDFFHTVGQKHGLSRPPNRLHKADRDKLAKLVISAVEAAADPITKSSHFPLIRKQIEQNPTPFAVNLGIQIKATPKALRTMPQIFTSKGKGPAWRDDE